MKFYDKGFITKYDDYIHLQIFNVGQLVLNLEIYKMKFVKELYSVSVPKSLIKNILINHIRMIFYIIFFLKIKFILKIKIIIY